MTPTDLRRCLQTLHWSQRGLADRLGVHETRVRRWASGVYPVPEAVGAWLERAAAAYVEPGLPEGWVLPNTHRAPPESVQDGAGRSGAQV